MRKTISLILLGLLCSVGMSRAADETIFKWNYDGSTVYGDGSNNGEFSITNTSGTGTVKFVTYEKKKTSAESGLGYNASVTDNDLKPSISNGCKLGNNGAHIKISPASGNFKPGDIIYICAYNPLIVSTGKASPASTTDINTEGVLSGEDGLATGSEKSSYNVGTLTLPANFTETNVIYISRKSSSVGIAAIKVVRPASTFSVTYNGNGKTSGDVPTDENSYDKNASVTVLGNSGNLEKTGHTFAGWNTQADGSGTTYTAGNKFSITSNTTLYAKWTANIYTVTLHENEGTINEGEVEEYTYGEGAILPTNVTKAGHDFGGWFDNSGLTGTAVTTIADDATGNKEYWAKWLAVYSVTHTLTNVTKTSGETTVTEGSAYVAIYAAADGYVLPDAITVTASGSGITANCTWTKGTGTLSIPAAYVTGDIEITVRGYEDVSSPEVSEGGSAITWDFTTNTSEVNLNGSAGEAKTLNATSGEGSMTFATGSSAGIKAKNKVYCLDPNGGTAKNGSVYQRYLVFQTSSSGTFTVKSNANHGTYSFYTSTSQSTLNDAIYNGTPVTTVTTSSESTEQTSSTITVSGDTYIFITFGSKIYSEKIVWTPSSSSSSLTLDVTSVGWATMYVDFDAKVPADASVYYVSGIDSEDGSLLTLVGPIGEDQVLPKNNGYLVKAAAGEYTFTQKGAGDADPETITSNLLHGLTSTGLTTGETGDKFYRLSYYTSPSVDLGFYYGAANGGAFTIDAYKAYLAVPSGSSNAPARFLINTEENNATSINEVEATDEAVKFIQDGELLIKKNGVIYDVMGRVIR